MNAATDPANSRSDAKLPRILIVDDSEETTRALGKVLSFAGFHPTIASRGQEALQLAKMNPCAAALVDVHLPDINGLVLSQQLREVLGAQTPIIVVSGDTSMEVINALPHVGATYFFSKPVNVTYLIERLKDWTNTHSDHASV